MYRIKKINESNPLVPGPSTDFDMFYNQRVVGNILQSDPNVINGFNTEMIEDDYFKEPLNKKRNKLKKRLKRKIKRFKEFEGAGFGHTDYRNVTGQATTSGYLNDKQPLNNSGGSQTIASTAPRGNYHEPETMIIGFKTDEIEDPYFIKRKKRKDKKKRDTWERRKREELSQKINNKYKRDKITG